jgi:hypothetical protein
VALWPFDGTLESLVHGKRIVVAEIYPRVAYSLAISRPAVQQRAPLAVSKTLREHRSAFLREMLSAGSWVDRAKVEIRNVGEAEASEDAFDALVAACGLLRCILERTPLSDRRLEDRAAEGGILGCGSVCLDLPEITFRPRRC